MLVSSRKRKQDDWDVSDIEESQTATVHGVVTHLSPLKTSRKNAGVRYFDGKISDGKRSVRMISFEPDAIFAV